MKTSAGLLAYKFLHGEVYVFLVHPGGPIWKNKDAQSWSIPKGEYTDEDPLAAAKREFQEETGVAVNGPFAALSPVKMRSGKVIAAWAVEQEIDADAITSNLFEMEWPPKSGKFQSFPEIDRGGWFTIETAVEKIIPVQQEFIHELLNILKLDRQRVRHSH